jgi:hypothetical protein
MIVTYSPRLAGGMMVAPGKPGAMSLKNTRRWYADTLRIFIGKIAADAESGHVPHSAGKLHLFQKANTTKIDSRR